MLQYVLHLEFSDYAPLVSVGFALDPANTYFLCGAVSVSFTIESLGVGGSIMWAPFSSPVTVFRVADITQNELEVFGRKCFSCAFAIDIDSIICAGGLSTKLFC